MLFTVFSHQKCYVFVRVSLFVCLSVCLSVPRIYIKVLPDMCFRPRNNRLHSRDDPDYDPDPISGLQSVSRAYMKLLADVCLGSSSENPLHFGDTRDPDYSHINLGGGLQLLTDCLVLIIIQHSTT